MTELLTAAQMRAIERAAIESGEVTGLELMERAGRGVVEAIFEEWPELAATDQRAVVLCGPGNNGGDGFVVARLLKEWGWKVEVFLYGDAGKLPVDAKVNYERWREMGEVVDLENYGALPTVGNIAALGGLYDGYDPLIVDAVFGTGLTRAPTGQLKDVLHNVKHIANFERTRVVSVDIPTGVCSDSGKRFGESAAASMTVTFHQAKIGHMIGGAAISCGKLRLVDIGIGKKAQPPHSLEIPVEQCSIVDAPKLGWKWPDANKYDHGHALIISGGPGKGGAARLAARGALRVGAGLVSVGCPPAALAENAAQLNAIMVRTVAGADALTEVLQDARINALCLGPGLGTDERASGLVAAALASPFHPSTAGEGNREGAGGALPLSASERGEGRGGPALVLDADALTILAGDENLFAALHDCCVLTPHAGEFARLFPDIAEKLEAPATRGPAYSKVDATREAAARAGCVVLFKGPDTVIAAADGRCSINSAHYERAAPWLATAGSGDVLAGFITGLLARGFAPMQAAETGAWLHVECALKFGPGLIAEDLPEQLPAVFRDLGL